MPAISRLVRGTQTSDGKGSAQEEQAGEAAQQMTSEGPKEAGAERSAPEAAMPLCTAGSAEMTSDTRAPVLSGIVPTQCSAA